MFSAVGGSISVLMVSFQRTDGIPPQYWRYPQQYLISLHITEHPPTVLNILHSTEHPPQYCTSSTLLNILNSSEHTSQFWTSSKGLYVLHCTENSSKYWKSWTVLNTALNTLYSTAQPFPGVLIVQKSRFWPVRQSYSLILVEQGLLAPLGLWYYQREKVYLTRKKLPYQKSTFKLQTSKAPKTLQTAIPPLAQVIAIAQPSGVHARDVTMPAFLPWSR